MRNVAQMKYRKFVDYSYICEKLIKLKKYGK